MPKIIYLLFLSLFLSYGCANTEQFHLYNPYPDKTVTLERKNVSCSDSSEIKVWYVLYGSYPINTINTKELFPSPDYSYKVEQVATVGDKIISIFTGLFFSVSRKTLRIDTCQLIKKENAVEKKTPELEPKPISTAYNDFKFEELEKEVAFLKGKISGMESTVRMVTSPQDETIHEQNIGLLPKEEMKSRSATDSLEKDFLNEPDTKQSADKKEIPTHKSIPTGLSHSHFLFKINSSSLSIPEKKKLENLKAIINKSDSKILIVGYTDRTGNPKTNLFLSWQRALEVKKTLMELGVIESRIQLSAAGETGDSGNSKSAAVSRRVDLYLVEEKL